VECGDLQACGVRFSQSILHALEHLVGCIFGVGESEDFIGAGVTLGDQVCNPADKDRRFSGASACNHQHWTRDMLNGFPLLWIR